MKKYQIDHKEYGPFEVEYRDSRLGGQVQRFLTQEFAHNGHSYRVSILQDMHELEHCYTLDSVDPMMRQETPFEVAIVKDNEFYEPTDIDYRFCSCDLDLINLIWDMLNCLMQHLGIQK